MGQFIWPVPTVTQMSSGFGYRPCATHGTELHLGIDILVDEEPVVAAHPGQVIKIKEDETYGKYMVLNYGDFTTKYAHLSKINVGLRSYVNAGDQIAVSGNTGTSTTPHLHFEFYYKGVVKDPLLYLSPTDNISNYTGIDDSKLDENTDIIPRNELSWSEINLLSTQAVGVLEVDWRNVINLKKKTSSVTEANIVNALETLSNEATEAKREYLPEGTADLSLTRLLENYQQIRQLMLNHSELNDFEPFSLLYSDIANKILVLSIKLESINVGISLFDTPTYRGIITNLYAESNLDSYETEKKSYEALLNDYQAPYLERINRAVAKMSSCNAQIITIENQINKITNKYSIIQEQLSACKKEYDEILQRIDSFNENFSSEYAYWNKDVIESPETLNFWLEFLDTEGELDHYSIPNVGDRTKVDNETNVTSIYFRDVPQVIFYGYDDDDQTIVNEKTGYTYINITDWAKDLFSESARGISAKEVIDDNLYNFAYCIEEISLSTIPIYYLKPNMRIFVYDKNSHIEGEFLISSLTIPVQYNGTMSISASKAPRRLY